LNNRADGKKPKPVKPHLLFVNERIVSGDKMGEVVLTNANFNDEVLKSTVPVLVDFWAAWCGPCQIIAPVISEIATEFAGKIKVGKLNVDENPVKASEFGILAIPTLLIFKDGKVVKKIVGFSGKPKLVAEINSVL